MLPHRGLGFSIGNLLGSLAFAKFVQLKLLFPDLEHKLLLFLACQTRALDWYELEVFAHIILSTMVVLHDGRLVLLEQHIEGTQSGTLQHQITNHHEGASVALLLW